MLTATLELATTTLYLFLLRSTDPAGKGLVTRERFLSILVPLLPPSALAALNRLADQIQLGQGMIPYPKFLAMFEHTTPQESSASTVAVATIVPDDSADEVCLIYRQPLRLITTA